MPAICEPAKTVAYLRFVTISIGRSAVAAAAHMDGYAVAVHIPDHDLLDAIITKRHVVSRPRILVPKLRSTRGK